jgi:hypothetical protein
MIASHLLLAEQRNTVAQSDRSGHVLCKSILHIAIADVLLRNMSINANLLRLD